MTSKQRRSSSRAPARKRPAPKGRSRSRRARPRGWRRTLLLTLLGLFVAFFLWLGALYVSARIPEPNDIAKAQSVTVVDRDGKPIGRIHAEADRVSIPLDEMPEHLRQAVIATEDRRFYEHAGVSPASIARAALANLVGRSIRQGGSTITQQYVKNAFVGNERSLFRKTREAVLAVKLERQRSKDEILELYLNTIYFGRGAYGVEAAAQAYFGRKARALTLPQSALLAGIIQAPEAYDDPDEVRARRAAVLGAMQRDGYISAEQAAEAAKAKLGIRRRRAGGIAPHYLEDVRRLLEREIGPATLYAGGVTVTATLDADMQRAAAEAVARVYDRADDPEAALVAIDPRTGAVRAMIGARDFGRRQLNLATRGKRHPGSTFKTMVLAAAIDEGIETTRGYPAPATATFPTDSGPWKVSNYDRRSHGTLTLARATELSVNTVYARVMLDIGPERVVEMSKDLGVRSDLDPVPSLALGTFDVSPIELTASYATLAARGVAREPYLVEKVTGRDGEVLFDADPIEGRTVDAAVADRVNAVLQGVMRNGTGRGAQIGRPAAGKTGTTEEFRDAWFAGYTPDLATVVWNGFPDGGKLLKRVRGRNVTGGSFPAQMWARFMRDALRDVPPTPFTAPGPEDGDPDAEPSPSSTTVAIPPSPTPSLVPTGSPVSSPTPTATATKTSPSPTTTKESSPSPSPSETGGEET